MIKLILEWFGILNIHFTMENLEIKKKNGSGI
jgi:hypothetical protein